MKRSVLLIIVLIVLLGIYWIVQSHKPVVKANRPFVEVDSAKVTSLILKTADDSVEMAKQGEEWMLTQPVQYPAAAKTIASTLGQFRTMTRLSMITENPDRFREFQVDDSAGVKVTVGGGKKNVTFYLGKMSSAGNSYARLDGSNEIWEIAGNAASMFKRKARDWRDKTITEIPAADFRKITLIYPDQTIILTQVDSVWKVTDNRGQFPAAKGTVERITGLLSRLSTVEFADTLSPAAFDKPELHLQAELADGETLDLKLIPKDAEATQYYVRKDGAKADFVVYKATANVLMKKSDDFKEKGPSAAEAAKTKSKA
jgi:hypothetical protein